MLDKNEINLQKVTILLSQLIDQIRVTETNKKNLDIEEINGRLKEFKSLTQFEINLT